MNPSNRPETLVSLQNRILARKGLLGCAREYTVALHHSGKAVYTGADAFGQRGVTMLEGVASIACATEYLVALLGDGTLRGMGNCAMDSRLKDLSHVRIVACSDTHWAALMGNGRVVIGRQADGKGSEAAEWSDVFDLVCGKGFTAGLTREGRVVIDGGSRMLQHAAGGWRDVAGIFTDTQGETLLGITVDGRLISTKSLPGCCREWGNLVYVAASCRHMIGITATGQLLSTDPIPADKWQGGYFVSCAVSDDHFVALTRDGRVAAMGSNRFGQCDTRCFGSLFSSFEEYSAARRAENLRMADAERTYQIRLVEAQRYCIHIACGERMTACISADGRVLTSGAYGRAREWNCVRSLACGNAHVVALHEDGTVSADGNNVENCMDVSEWRGIKSIQAGKYHTLGLTEEGTVLCCGRDSVLKQEITAWNGISRMETTDEYAVGVGYDGTIHVAGKPPFPRELLQHGWDRPTSLAVTSTHASALYANGRVRTTATAPTDEKCGDETIELTNDWRNIRSIAVGKGFTVGLCYGGRVVSVSSPGVGECDTSEWRDVVAVGCGFHYAAGLTSDGRVMVVCTRPELAFGGGANPDTTLWKDVLTMRCGPYHIVALTSSGQILSCGLDTDRQCSATTHFTLFRDPRQLYGYGRYSRRLELEIRSHQEVDCTEVIPEIEEGILPFKQIAGALREDTYGIQKRLVGSDRHLSILTEEGNVKTYLYETEDVYTDICGDNPPYSLKASEGETVLFFSQGKARVRKVDALHKPLSSLHDRMGESQKSPAVDVAYSDRHAAILTKDGTMRVFEVDDYERGELFRWNDVISVASGQNHIVGLKSDGTVVSVEANRTGNKVSKDGVTSMRPPDPCAVNEWRDVATIQCAGDVTLGLRTDGRVLSAGNNRYGQCNTEDWRGAVSVVTSGNHTVALFADGHVEAVGHNEDGECRTEAWRRVIQISVMPKLTLGLRADGKVLAAGRHHKVLQTLEGVRAIACFGNRRQVFVMADGTIRIHRRGSEYLPAPVADFRLFTPSVGHSVLHRVNPHGNPLLAARSLRWSWGVGINHILTLGKGGLIQIDNRHFSMKATQSAVQIASGPYHVAAIRADGFLYTTGRANEGQCDHRLLNENELGLVGMASEDVRGAPIPILNSLEPAAVAYAWKQVACGYTHTAALRSDGHVFAVGANPDGRCDTRKWRNVTEVACGVRHTLAVTDEGICLATGDNRYGQCDVALWKQVTMVAAGEFHSVGLRADGRVEAAGDNRKGQCHVEDLRDIVSIACLPEATLCVTAEGRVILRGGSGEHDKAVEALREIVAVHACEHRIAALTADGRLIHIP